MTIADVSRHLGLSWDIAKSIQKRHLQKKYTNPNLNKLEQIAIDDISVGKHHYLTIVIDILNGAVIFVGDGKGREALDINKPMATVYYVKEDLRQIWNWTDNKKSR